MKTCPILLTFPSLLNFSFGEILKTQPPPLQLKTQRRSSGYGNNFNPSTTPHSTLSLAISKIGADLTFYLRVDQNFHAVQNSLQNKHQFARKTKNVGIIVHTE